MSGPRVSVDDLDFAVAWLQAYEGESGNPIGGQDPEDDDESQARLRRVAEWVDAEISRRLAAAQERETIRLVAERHGRDPKDPAVRAAVRKHLREARTEVAR